MKIYSNAVLLSILKTELAEKEYEWILQKSTSLRTGFKSSNFYTSFSMCTRFIEKKDIQNTDFKQFNTVELSRLALLLLIPANIFEQFKSIFYSIFDMADVSEQEALYLSFDYLPFAQELAEKFALGISTNIATVFEKLALHNAFPHKYLSESAFNQLVIKTIFTEKNILEIIGLEKRLNSELSRMAKELLEERIAAGRSLRKEVEILISVSLQ